jgi:hypothetical protein
MNAHNNIKLAFMKNIYVKIILVILIFSIAIVSFAQTNIALRATVSTSYVSPWETLSAVNDNSNPLNSGDRSSGAYGNWDHPNTLDWVEYDWLVSYTISKTEVYWFDDEGGILTPTTSYIEYWNGSAWVNCGNIPAIKDTWNTLNISNINTTRIRISMLNSSQSTGILEWRVWATDSCAPSLIKPYIQVKHSSRRPSATVAVNVGGTVKFSPKSTSGGSWIWSGPNNFSATTRNVTIKNIQWYQSGTYVAKYINKCGSQSIQNFQVTVNGAEGCGKPYNWPAYNPTLNYNFKNEYPGLSTPTQDLDDCPQVVGSQSSDWWTFRWGPNKNALVTSEAITPMLQRMNTDFAYFRDTMGWPPDKRAKNGYRSAVYLYGSGLCTDNATNTDLGGWQSSIYYNGQEWPMVLASYYPIYSFDPACPYGDKLNQQGAMVHEGIHSVLADLPGCKQAAWFQEGGNTWLQQEAAARQSKDFSSMGFLNGCTFLAPFMPIECYTGWLQDGSFGGPSAEGVNMTNSSGQQLCTWRTYLGGNQYGNTFPTFLGLTLGDGSVPWIWRNCPGRVLEGMAAGLGDKQMRRLIAEYRAKQALIDFGPWNKAIEALLDDHFKQSIGAEWQPSWLNPDPWIATPYAKTTNNGKGLLTPENLTTPGWSGANQIPLKVSGKKIAVYFKPIGANMTCQLCYRAIDGTAVYSQIVSSGNCTLQLDKAPASGVVIAVICNTDYIYYGESTRTAHYDYRLQLITGVVGAADIYTKWYTNGATLKSAPTNPLPAFDISRYCNHGLNGLKPIAAKENKMADANTLEVRIYPNPVKKSEMLNIDLSNLPQGPKQIEIINTQGQTIYKEKIDGSVLTIKTGDLLEAGLYLVTISNSNITKTYKLLVQHN